MPSPYDSHHPAGPPRYYEALSMVAAAAGGGEYPSMGGYNDGDYGNGGFIDDFWNGSANDRNSASVVAAQAAANATNTYHHQQQQHHPHHPGGVRDYGGMQHQQQSMVNNNNHRTHGGHVGGRGVDHRGVDRDGRPPRSDYRDRSRSSYQRPSRR